MKKIIDLLSSVKLTLALMLGLAIVAIGGTIRPIETGRYELFYQSPGYRLLLGLLALNLLVCTIKTIRRNLGDRQRFHDLLARQPDSAMALPARLDLKAIAAVLNKRGYRGVAVGNQLVLRKGILGRWGSTIVHVFLLVLMLGGVIGEAGFVGTMNTYLGDVNRTYFDWDVKEDRPLGFGLRVDKFYPSYYPIVLRFDLVDPRTGQVIGQVTTREGEDIDFPLPGVTAHVEKFDPDEKVLTLVLKKQGQVLGDYLVFADGERYRMQKNPGVQVKQVQYKDPILKQTHSEVTIVENGRDVASTVIRVNEPLTYKGVSIYQIHYDRNEHGFWSVGFQLSSDPGEPLVWIGCVALILGLLAAFMIPYRAIGVARYDDRFYLLPMMGFRSEEQKEQFLSLVRVVEEMVPKKQEQD